VNDRLREIADEVARITAENSALLARIEESERRFRRISRGVLRLQEEERARISRDLHDGIGQSLTALKIQLALLESGASGSPELSGRLRSTRELAEGCLAEVRQLSRMLRPPMLDELGLVSTLQWLTRTLTERTGLPISFRHEGDEGRTDPDVATLVYRIVQEALTNAIKHASASSASVLLTTEAGRIAVRIEDSGSGFDASAILAAQDDGQGFGVRAMRDRVQLFHGRFSIGPASGGGTAVTAEVPLHGDEAARR
jgi:two-component system, NarL family, sensor kinase